MGNSNSSPNSSYQNSSSNDPITPRDLLHSNPFFRSRRASSNPTRVEDAFSVPAATQASDPPTAYSQPTPSTVPTQTINRDAVTKRPYDSPFVGSPLLSHDTDKGILHDKRVQHEQNSVAGLSALQQEDDTILKASCCICWLD
jgi:hypothetical protein